MTAELLQLMDRLGQVTTKRAGARCEKLTGCVFILAILAALLSGGLGPEGLPALL